MSELANRELLQIWLAKAAKDAKRFDHIELRENREQAARLIAVLNVYQGFPLEQLTEQEVELALNTCIRYGKQLDQLVHPERKPICVLKREYFSSDVHEKDDMPFNRGKKQDLSSSGSSPVLSKRYLKLPVKL